jgi:integrase
MKDISFADCTIKASHKPEYGWTPKAYKERTVPVPPQLIAKLKARSGDGLLFSTRTGGVGHHFLEMSKAIARRAGLSEEDVWLHKFRSTFCTRALRFGFDLRTVQDWMGHADLQSTLRYLKPERGPGVQGRVAAMWA